MSQGDFTEQHKAWKLLSDVLQALEGHSIYFRGHSTRVANLARKLALGLQLRPQEVELIFRAGLVHDLGQIRMPEAMLNKRGNLGPQERPLMMAHPQFGAKFLEQAGLSELSSLVRHHHEWYDGRGYPDGLAQGDIPIGAAVLAVAEAYDALTSDRPYRQAVGEAAAIAEIQAGAGSQFHPQVVEVLLARAETAVTRPARAGSVPLNRTSRRPWLAERELRIFQRVAGAMELVLDVDPLLNEVCRILQEEMEVPMAVIRLLDPATGDLILGGTTGRFHQRPARFERGSGILGWVAEHRESVNVSDVHLDPRAIDPFPNLRALAAVPMLSQGGLVGVLGIASDLPGVFGEDDVHLLNQVSHTLAATVAVARLHQEVKLAATQDYLTGVANRREMLAQLAHRFREAQHSSKPLAVAMVDVNGLKEINDRLGHKTGDQAIQVVAAALTAGVSADDLVGRYGGDEFLVLLVGLNRAAAEAVLAKVQPPDNMGYHLGWSWGVAAFPEDAEVQEDLITLADVRLYEAKERRRRLCGRESGE